MLLLLAVVSAFTDILFVAPGERNYMTVGIITVMVAVSGVLRFVQETRSGNVAEKLTAMIHTTACLERAGVRQELPMEEIVVGDIVHLSAGDMIPANLRILQAQGPVHQPVGPDRRERAGGKDRRAGGPGGGRPCP